MDSDRFDTLTRTLPNARSRRWTLAAIFGAALAPLLAREDTAAHDLARKCKKLKGDNKKKCLKKAKKHNAQHASESPPPPSPCANGLQDGSETDVDCGGGTCRRCGITQTCLTRNDCASARCEASTCQPCANAVTDCGNDADGVTGCACREHESGQRFCTKNGTGDVRLLPAGTPCTACQGGEQCFPINGGANGIECIRPCGAP